MTTFFISNKKIVNIENKGRLWRLKLRKAGINAGLTKMDEKGKPIPETVIFPHRLRHSYANYLLNVKGIDIKYVQETLRHTSITSTEIYIYVNKEELKEKLSKA